MVCAYTLLVVTATVLHLEATGESIYNSHQIRLIRICADIRQRKLYWLHTDP